MNRLDVRPLQAVVALACLVPLMAGGAGVIFGPAMTAALVMELGVTPALAVWQYRLARKI